GAVAVVLPLEEGGQADEAALTRRHDRAEARALRCARAVVGVGRTPGEGRDEQGGGPQRQRRPSQVTGTAVATRGFSAVRPYCSPTFPSRPGNSTTVCSPSISSTGWVVMALSESAITSMWMPWVAMSPW